MAVGTKLFFDMMHDLPPKIMLFGDACSHVTAPIAESSVWWNIWQLSYADTNPLLSNRKRYPNFFRTVPSDGDYNPARISFIRHFNWTRVGTLFQDASRGSARYAYAHDNFIALLDKANITRVTQSFSTDPEPALTNLKENDIRVIFGNFDAEMARKVFCAAIKEKMFGPRYVWMLLGDYPDGWWLVDDSSISCTPTQLGEAVDGYFSTDVLRLSTSGRRTISRLTATEYNDLYEATRGGNYSKFHGYAYDGIWVIAKAIDSVIRENGGQYNFRDFRGEGIQRALNDTDFEGVTGRVLFGNGDRIGNLVYQQLQGGQMRTVGEFSDLHACLDFTKGRAITWRGVGPPRDGTVIEKQLVRVNLTVYVILCTIAGLGIVVALSFLAINIRFRKHKYIKMSSPNLNNIITIGCVLTYTSVFLLGTDSRLINSDSFHIMCSIRAWVLSFGFTLSFGAMFSKTWRVHAIFTNIKLNKKVIKDYRLFFMVAVFLVVDCLILGAWQSIDPPSRQVIYLQSEVGEWEVDKEIIPVVEFCISRHMTTWLGIIYAYKGLLLVFGCFLAWETREVTIPALNDSKYIGMSVYNVVIICIAGVAVAAIIENDPNSAFLILSTFIIFCTTVTLCLVFVPKIIELRKDPVGNDRRIRATLRKAKCTPVDSNSSVMQDDIRHLMQENARYKQLLEEKKLKVQELLVELGEESYTWDVVTNSLSIPAGGVILPTTNGPLTTQTGVQDSDDESPLVSSTSDDVVWPFNGRSDGLQTTTSDGVIDRIFCGAEAFEMGKLKTCSSLVNDLSGLSHRTPLTAGAKHDVIVVSTPCDSGGLASSSRSNIVERARTPSYPGLKFMHDFCSLKETAILSDSDTDVCDQNSAAKRMSLDGDINIAEINNLQHVTNLTSVYGANRNDANTSRRTTGIAPGSWLVG
ncbi:hypothetical protein NP493_13g08014 [Ridgeia piscesae]|uniref:Gamma-aminobutyric acid type B receptor subunit 2 n=1 Tax=Ridgeia piscesae TaxID=27915 RepID=A0AAD9PF46_RIDPI|nr:hypothetical protein NP493_13g08014 [Ridgeia piscesae]